MFIGNKSMSKSMSESGLEYYKSAAYIVHHAKTFPEQKITSNLTARHRRLKWKLQVGLTEPSLQWTSHIAMRFHLRVLYCMLFLRYACIQSSASSISPGYLCAKFCFFCILHCWASPRRKIAYSITHSITQLIWCPRNQSFHFRILFCSVCGTRDLALLWLFRL